MRCAAVAILVLAVCAGCSRGDPPPDAASESTRPSQAAIDRLRALGYVGFTEQVVDPDEPAVSDFDETRSWPGYNLISNRDLASAQLLDPLGNVVHSWHDEHAIHWANAELLEGGDLLVTGSDAGGNFVLRLSWDGSVRWRSRVNGHHDAEVTPQGLIAALTFRFRMIPAISETMYVKDNNIALLTAGGELIEEFSVYDTLAADAEHFELQYVARMNKAFVDLLHANSVEWMCRPALAAKDPLYAPSNVVVSLRHQDTVAVFDMERRRLVWAWGQGELSGQHDATVLDNGHFLIFDNGLDRGHSRVIELDPLEKRIVWSYEDPDGFFSLSRGSNQRLPNGNTLIANSDEGEAFEVTPEGEIVWRFRNFNTNDEGRRATIVRIKRYPRQMIERLLAES